jgi:hypothetical protein
MGPKPVLFRLAKFLLEDLANCGFIELWYYFINPTTHVGLLLIKQQSLMNIIWYEKGVVHQYM